MANLTKVQLRERIARHLKLSSQDIELDASTAHRIDEAIDDASAELRERGLCWWGEDEVPQPVVFPMTLIVSAQVCTSFGRAGQGYEAGDGDGRSRLSTLKTSADITPVRVSYF